MPIRVSKAGRYMVPGQCAEPQDNVLGTHPWSYSFRTHSPHKNDHPPPPNYTASHRRPVVIRVARRVACGHLGPKGCIPYEQSFRTHSSQKYGQPPASLGDVWSHSCCGHGARPSLLGSARTLHGVIRMDLATPPAHCHNPKKYRCPVCVCCSIFW